MISVCNPRGLHLRIAPGNCERQARPSVATPGAIQGPSLRHQLQESMHRIVPQATLLEEERRRWLPQQRRLVLSITSDPEEIEVSGGDEAPLQAAAPRRARTATAKGAPTRWVCARRQGSGAGGLGMPQSSCTQGAGSLDRLVQKKVERAQAAGERRRRTSARAQAPVALS